MIADPDFKGYIHDVGGPTANFRKPACSKQLTHGACRNRQCLFPYPCRNLEVDHSDYLALLRKLRALPGVKKVFVRSGIRFDYLLCDKDDSFFRELVEYHVSGQLKVAPGAHLRPGAEADGQAGPQRVQPLCAQIPADEPGSWARNQYLVPYLMSSHPGSTLKEAVELAEYPARPGLYARAGAGLLSHAVYHLDGHVLHRLRPPHHGDRSTPPPIPTRRPCSAR